MDLIRFGKAPEVVRRKGAEGKLPVPTAEKIEILALLAAAPESELRAKSLATLQGWDRAELCRIMASPQTAPYVLRVAAEKLATAWDELRDLLLLNPSLPEESQKFLLKHGLRPEIADTPANPSSQSPAPPPAETLTLALAKAPLDGLGSVPADNEEEVKAVEILAKLAAGTHIDEVTGLPVETPPEVTKRDDELTPRDRETLIQKVQRMSVVQKIKAALTGNMETRALLIRDSNKIISRAVLQSPKVSETEVENYAAAKNVSEEVLRLIAANRKFMKSYVVVRALIHNPRAPIVVTMPLVARMTERDLKGLSTNRNVPDVIRGMAAKIMRQREEASKPKLPGKH